MQDDTTPPRFAPLARNDAAMNGSPLRCDMLTSPEIHALVQQGMDLAILLVGATEQHGPHLATGCDTLLPKQIALLVPRHTGVPVLPAIPYGCLSVILTDGRARSHCSRGR